MPDDTNPSPPVLDYGPPLRRRYGTGLIALLLSLLFIPLAVAIVAWIDPELLIGLWIMSAILGIVLGIVVTNMDQPEDESNRRLGRWAIRSGWVGIAVLVVGIFSLTANTGGSAKERHNRPQCITQLKQIGHVLTRYSQDHGGAFPPVFTPLVGRYAGPALFVCPSSADECATGSTVAEILADFAQPRRCSYLYFGTTLSRPLPPGAILACDRYDNHEGEGIHALYANGTVKWIPRPEAVRILAELEAGHNPPRPK